MTTMTMTTAPGRADDRQLERGGFAAFVSVAVHALLFCYLSCGILHAVPRASHPEEIALEVVEKPKVLPPPPKPEIVPARKIPRIAPRLEKVPPPKAPPPPPAKVEPPPTTPPPPIRIGVNLESTVPGGDIAAPVGNSMYGEAPKTAPVPVATPLPYWSAKYVAPGRVAELPVLLEDVKAPYPLEARKAGIEGQVVLMLTIDDQGVVAEVRRISGPGHGLDEAALAAARRFRFKPARYNGTSVATQIRYVYSFEID